ncbi:MAG: DUF4416 family protein [Candidatus Omnitrophota bacterium]|nr:MAG: DUF4416 family protein [Candidatus Omnitrophota bacterium]
MGTPLKHAPVKLIVGFISSKPAQFISARHILEKKFGKIDKEMPLLDFSCTRYYEKEFGKNLKRKFLSFENLIPLGKNYDIKLYTNKIEERLSENNARTINIDPGYISLAKLVLFTTKNRSHRIYIDKGIYGDLELHFIKKSFQALPWTYPDYRTGECIDFFNSVRAVYLNQTKRI